MATKYNKQITLANKLLTKYGTTLTLKRLVANKSENRFVTLGNTYESFPCYGCVFPARPNDNLIDPVKEVFTDNIYLSQEIATPPQVGDIIFKDEISFTIKYIEVVNVDLTDDVLYICNCVR